MNTRTYKNFTVSRDSYRITTVKINVRHHRMNVFNREVMYELSQVISDLDNADSKLIVFESGLATGFFAGADVSLIADIDSPSEANRLLEKGQQLFNRLERMRVPTVAVIHGPCLGGGLEFALACSYRIGRKGSNMRIGLPEINLGLIPGWGGTVRLTRQVGTQQALSMILTGKHISAEKALKIGLLDLRVDSDDRLHAALQQILKGQAIAKKKGGPLWQRIVDQTNIGRWLMLQIASRTIASKAKNYPALPAAIRAVQAGGVSVHNGLVSERTEFVRLLETKTCRNLLGLFFAREMAKKPETWQQAGAGSNFTAINRVGVIGAGTMGAGIGQFVAAKGFDVVLKEVNDSAVTAGRKRLDRLIEKYAARKRMSPVQKSNLTNRISISCDEAMLADCDLIIEAAPETMETKKAVFSMLGRVAKEDAMLVSNTSSLSITQMAACTGRTQNVAGLHFFNPVHRMELVEIVRANQTDAATIARLVAFTKSLGKTPIVTADSPGFLINRVLFPYLSQAIVLLDEGHEPAKIDRQIRRFGMPMGPLELMDQVGIDIAMHVANSLGSVATGLSTAHERLGMMVEKGRLGAKTGKGFYDYRRGQKQRPASWLRQSTTKPMANGQDIPHDDHLTDIQRRLIYPMLTEAIRCLHESVVQHWQAIDLGMVLGTGFAPYRGGPLHMVDDIGADKFLANLQHLEHLHGRAFAAPAKLCQVADEGRLFCAATFPYNNDDIKPASPDSGWNESTAFRNARTNSILGETPS